MSLIAVVVHFAGALTLAIAAAGCVDHGGAYIVDNRTDQEFVARVSGPEDLPGSAGGWRHRQDVLTIPAQSRLAVAVVGFTDRFSVKEIQILTQDCAVVVATFSVADEPALGSGGQVILIKQGPSASLRREFPWDGILAGATDRCDNPFGG